MNPNSREKRRETSCRVGEKIDDDLLEEIGTRNGVQRAFLRSDKGEG